MSFFIFNRNGMKKMVGHSWKVWVLSALLFCGIAGVLFKVSPVFFSTIQPLDKKGADALSSKDMPLAPSFASRSLDGQVVASTQFAGKVYIVNFFASWCPPCRAEIPDMVALQERYGRKGFTFIGVAVNETEPAIRDFIAKNRMDYPVVMADDKIVSAFSRYVAGGLSAIPTSFVVNSSGHMTQVITGGRSKEDFEKIIVDALGKPGTPQ